MFLPVSSSCFQQQVKTLVMKTTDNLTMILLKCCFYCSKYFFLLLFQHHWRQIGLFLDAVNVLITVRRGSLCTNSS